MIDPPMDEARNRARFPEMIYNEIPHGKQNWYVQTGGIWQPVWFEVKPRLYIEQVHVTPRVDGEVRVEVQLSAGKGLSGMSNQGLQVTVRNPDGQVEFTQTLRAHDAGIQPFSGRVKAPIFGVTATLLYTVEVQLEGHQARGSDSFRERFGSIPASSAASR